MLADHGFVIMKPDGSTQDPAHLLEEIEAAKRLRRILREARDAAELRRLNRELAAAVDDSVLAPVLDEDEAPALVERVWRFLVAT